VKLRNRNVIVTCCHVWDELETIRRQWPTAELVGYFLHAAEGSLVVLNRFELIDRDRKSLDVAVLGGTENEIFLPGALWVDYEKSYIEDPQPGEPILIVGYPGDNIRVSESKADFGHMLLGLCASSISDRQITLVNEHGTREYNDFDEPIRSGISFGGLSGSAAYLIRDSIPRFVGIVTECSEAEKTVDRTIMISRLGCLNPNGTLDHSKIPW
jgi:hypothetical protein